MSYKRNNVKSCLLETPVDKRAAFAMPTITGINEDLLVKISDQLLDFRMSVLQNR